VSRGPILTPSTQCRLLGFGQLGLLGLAILLSVASGGAYRQDYCPGRITALTEQYGENPCAASMGEHSSLACADMDAEPSCECHPGYVEETSTGTCVDALRSCCDCQELHNILAVGESASSCYRNSGSVYVVNNCLWQELCPICDSIYTRKACGTTTACCACLDTTHSVEGFACMSASVETCIQRLRSGEKPDYTTYEHSLVCYHQLCQSQCLGLLP
jgi:hypothetical protein